MTTAADEREQAIAAADETCPRCGARREPGQRYCLDCGLELPPVTGRLPALRRRWIRRLGWYPGDWIWISLATLGVAIAGAGVAVGLTESSRATAAETVVATQPVSVAQPTPVPTTTAASTTTTSRRRPSRPQAPPAVVNGRLPWPANENGWTVVLVSYPKVGGQAPAVQTAVQAARSGLPQVGVLDSSRYPSLQPGYFVVFSGIYGTADEAGAAVPTARAAGFGTAYSRQVAR